MPSVGPSSMTNLSCISSQDPVFLWRGGQRCYVQPRWMNLLSMHLIVLSAPLWAAVSTPSARPTARPIVSATATASATPTSTPVQVTPVTELSPLQFAAGEWLHDKEIEHGGTVSRA